MSSKHRTLENRAIARYMNEVVSWRSGGLVEGDGLQVLLYKAPVGSIKITKTEAASTVAAPSAIDASDGVGEASSSAANFQESGGVGKAISAPDT